MSLCLVTVLLKESVHLCLLCRIVCVIDSIGLVNIDCLGVCLSSLYALFLCLCIGLISLLGILSVNDSLLLGIVSRLVKGLVVVVVDFLG